MKQSVPLQITTIKFRDGKSGDFNEDRRKNKGGVDMQFAAAMRIVREIESRLISNCIICESSLPDDIHSPGVDSLQFRNNVLTIVQEWLNQFRTNIKAILKKRSDDKIGILHVMRL